MTKKQLHLVIVTGMSGAGKTVAIQSFEDLGYFTIDNMPPALLPKFLQLVEIKEDNPKLALVVDMRSRSFFSEIGRSLQGNQTESPTSSRRSYFRWNQVGT